MTSSRQLFQILSKEIEAIYSAGEAKEISFILLKYLYALSKTDVLADKPLKNDKQKELSACLERIKTQEPIQYIVGETEFYGHAFLVNSSVLIPRQETEELVKLIIEENKNKKSLRVIDIGTGSGCIPISLKSALPFAEVSTIDISHAAIDLASKNAAFNHTEINFIEADILQESFVLPASDVIVSNPPYVLESEKKDMHKNVLDYEPGLALFVPDLDPLTFYKAITLKAAYSLAKEGRLYFEINERFGRETAALLETDFKNIRIIQDINGKDRIVSGEKK